MPKFLNGISDESNLSGNNLILMRAGNLSFCPNLKLNRNWPLFRLKFVGLRLLHGLKILIAPVFGLPLKKFKQIFVEYAVA